MEKNGNIFKGRKIVVDNFIKTNKNLFEYLENKIAKINIELEEIRKENTKIKINLEEKEVNLNNLNKKVNFAILYWME